MVTEFDTVAERRRLSSNRRRDETRRIRRIISYIISEIYSAPITKRT